MTVATCSLRSRLLKLPVMNSTLDLLLLFLLAVLFGAAQDQDLDGVSNSRPLMTAMELLESNKFPIVYFYTMNENACHKGLPNYLTDSINQAIHTQTECCQVLYTSLVISTLTSTSTSTYTSLLLFLLPSTHPFLPSFLPSLMSSISYAVYI